MNKGFFCLGAHDTIVHEVGSEAITKANCLAYWKGGSGGNVTALKFELNVALQMIEMQLDRREVVFYVPRCWNDGSKR